MTLEEMSDKLEVTHGGEIFLMKRHGGLVATFANPDGQFCANIVKPPKDEPIDLDVIYPMISRFIADNV